MTVWLTIPPLAKVSQVTVNAFGYADGIKPGKLHIGLYNNGVPIGQFTDGDGTHEIHANAYAQLTLSPGRQYKLSAKPIGGYKTLRAFQMHVAVNRTCP